MAERDDLERRISELEATLEELRRELDSRDRRRLPSPPRPRSVLRFADEYAIPAAIAALEANVRALELLQGAIRATGGGDPAGRATERIERALDSVSRAMEEGRLPRNPEARELVSDARRLAEEVRERAEGRASDDAGTAGEAVRIDVESELDSIREEVGAEDGGDQTGSNR